MKRLGEMLVKAPTPEQAEILAHVLEVARAWEAGALPLEALRAHCTGHERWTAMRVAGVGTPEKQLLMRLADALVDAQREMVQSDHGLLEKADLHRYGARAMTNWEGKRVYVFPMAWIGNEPQFPLVHMPPGDERTEKEAAIRAVARKG